MTAAHADLHRTTVNPALLAAFNRGTSRAIRANRRRAPKPLLTEVCLDCGRETANARGLAIHKAQHCPGREAL